LITDFLIITFLFHGTTIFLKVCQWQLLAGRATHASHISCVFTRQIDAYWL